MNDKDDTITTISIKKPSLTNIKNGVGSGLGFIGDTLAKAGNAVLNAKTPSIKEVGSGINKAQKSVRHKVASLIDSE